MTGHLVRALGESEFGDARALFRSALLRPLAEEDWQRASARYEPGRIFGALEWLLADRRACRVADVGDDLWLRLVDVPVALAARTFGEAEPVLIEVRDAFMLENSGVYRIGPDGVAPSDGTPELSLDADVLGALYLG